MLGVLENLPMLGQTSCKPQVTLEEFTDGILRCKGPARAVDQAGGRIVRWGTPLGRRCCFLSCSFLCLSLLVGGFTLVGHEPVQLRLTAWQDVGVCACASAAKQGRHAR